MHGLRLRAIPKSFGPDKNNVEPIFYLRSNQEQQGILKIPPFFRWWITIGYYGLFIPYKPILDANGRYKLRSNQLQKVSCIFLSYVYFLKTSPFKTPDG